MFKTLDEAKSVAEKFHAGKVVPKRIISLNKKWKKKAHKVVFGNDCFLIQTKKGDHILFSEIQKGNELTACVSVNGSASCIVKVNIPLSELKKLHMQCLPYSNGRLHLVGNYEIDETEFLKVINDSVFGKPCMEL